MASNQKYLKDLDQWIKDMQAKPSMAEDAARTVQIRINKIIPEKIHAGITAALKQMTKVVILGAGKLSSSSYKGKHLDDRMIKAKKVVRMYRTGAATEGAVTGFGGILMGVADLPLWLSIKMKMLFELASVFGFDTTDYKERLFILHIFQLTFSSQENRNSVFARIERWDQTTSDLPDNLDEFDWRTFQLQYRDYLDIAKLLQLIPGIGALVGAVVNHQLTEKLGQFAINCYLLRLKESIEPNEIANE